MKKDDDILFYETIKMTSNLVKWNNKIVKYFLYIMNTQRIVLVLHENQTLDTSCSVGFVCWPIIPLGYLRYQF